MKFMIFKTTGQSFYLDLQLPLHCIDFPGKFPQVAEPQL